MIIGQYILAIVCDQVRAYVFIKFFFQYHCILFATIIYFADLMFSFQYPVYYANEGETVAIIVELNYQAEAEVNVMITTSGDSAQSKSFVCFVGFHFQTQSTFN